MNKELFELCKAVYEKTGWSDTHKHYGRMESGNYVASCGLFEKHQETPLYTSDYLLEKLPKRISVNLDLMEGQTTLTAYYGQDYPLQIVTNTPLKSLLKLTIALREAGELK